VLDEAGLLTAWNNDAAADGIVTVLTTPRDAVETRAIAFVREHGLRATDAWHLAAAAIVMPDLVEPGEPGAFASRDAQQAAVAELLGFTTI
jgi:predicted nucleic acid-binding protein